MYKAFIIDLAAPVAPVARYMAEQMDFFEENQLAHILKASTRASNKINSTTYWVNNNNKKKQPFPYLPPIRS